MIIPPRAVYFFIIQMQCPTWSAFRSLSCRGQIGAHRKRQICPLCASVLLQPQKVFPWTSFSQSRALLSDSLPLSQSTEPIVDDPSKAFSAVKLQGGTISPDHLVTSRDVKAGAIHTQQSNSPWTRHRSTKGLSYKGPKKLDKAKLNVLSSAARAESRKRPFSQPLESSAPQYSVHKDKTWQRHCIGGISYQAKDRATLPWVPSTEDQLNTYRYREPWQTQKAALSNKFGSMGWSPRKRLSPDALEGIRALHAQHPAKFTTPAIAEQFQISPEAVRRILKSKWKPNEEEEERRLQRWSRRGENIWSQMAQLGLKPPKKWRANGVGKLDDHASDSWGLTKVTSGHYARNMMQGDGDLTGGQIRSEQSLADRLS